MLRQRNPRYQERRSNHPVYQQLRYFEESPKLPYGYFGMVVTAVAFNGHFQEKMTEELKRKQLGPFRPTQEQALAA